MVVLARTVSFFAESVFNVLCTKCVMIEYKHERNYKSRICDNVQTVKELGSRSYKWEMFLNYII